MRTLVAVTAAAFLLTACTKEETKPAEAAKKENTVKVAEAVPPPPPPAAAADPKALMTEEKLRGYVEYQKAITGVAGEMMGALAGAAAKAPGDEKAVEKAMDRKDFAKAAEDALKKGGLSQQDVGVLGSILSEYYTTRMFALDAQKSLDEAKAKGKKPLAAGVLQGQVDQGEAARKAFGEKYGADALAAADKVEPDFIASQKALLDAALKPRK